MEKPVMMGRATYRAQKLAEWIQRRSKEECSNTGDQPYPDVADVVEGHLVVAGLDSGKEYAAPTLTIYSPSDVEVWFELFTKAVLENDKLPEDERADWTELLYETEPDNQ